MIEPRALSIPAVDRQRIAHVEQLATLGPAGVAELIAGLADASWPVRRAVVGALARIGDDAVAPLCSWLQHERSSERAIAAAVDSLATSRGATTNLAVTALLADERPPVVADAAMILGRRRAVEVVPRLAALLADLDDNVAVAAIEALGAIGGPAAVEALSSVASHTSFFRTFPALQALSRLADVPAVVEPAPVRTTPTLGRQLVALFAALIEDASGLHYGPDSRDLFVARLETLAAELGISLLDYFFRVRYADPDGRVMGALVESLLIHETYFFRELGALEKIADHLAATVRATGRARVWCAACSTGEEAFTLAMLLDRRGVLGAVTIVATDLSTLAIDRARTGRLGVRAVRDIRPPELVTRYLAIDAHGITVAPAIRNAVQFATMNLVAASPPDLEPFDAIACRNVLIYFRDELIVRVIDRLADRLVPGGILAVGVSESLMRFGTKLTCIERGGAYLYQRAA